MQPQIPEIFDHISTTYCITGIITAVTLMLILKSSDRPNLDKIPTVGSRTWLGSWWAGITFLGNATEVIQEGYEKYKSKPFKVAMFYNWMVVVSGPQYMEVFRKSRDDELNFPEAVGEILQAKYTPFGHDTFHNLHHIRTLCLRLGHNLTAMYADTRDEICMAFDEILNLKGHEWKSIPVLSTMNQIVSRTNNRAFVGLPLCRDLDWVNLNTQLTMDVIKSAAIISLFPKFMAPLVAPFMINVPASIRRGMRLLAPHIEARQEQLEEFGESWANKPNDLLQWLMEGTEGSQRDARDITSRVLLVNFVAIHTFSHAFAQTLCSLAAHPQYIQDLRDEVEPIIKEEGWSKAAVAKMHKIDSFMKETQRINGIGFVTMPRKTMKDVTFPDGTVIPKDTFTMVASQPMHLDDEVYENAKVFDPFRFAKLRAEDGANVKHQFSVTSAKYLVFGHSRHACPGRFFAAGLLNTMLAHIVLSYDVKLEDGGTCPRNLRIGASTTASNSTARIMIRKRVA